MTTRKVRKNNWRKSETINLFSSLFVEEIDAPIVKEEELVGEEPVEPEPQVEPEEVLNFVNIEENEKNDENALQLNISVEKGLFFFIHFTLFTQP